MSHGMSLLMAFVSQLFILVNTSYFLTRGKFIEWCNHTSHVMWKVFEHVNTMLRGDQACLQRRLNIRTYKIVPTTPQSGIIEWVQNTIPFGWVMQMQWRVMRCEIVWGCCDDIACQ